MFVDAALCRRLEALDATFGERIADAFAAEDRAAGEATRAGALRVAGAVAAWPAPESMLSKVHALGLEGEPGDAELDAIEAFFRERGDRRVQVELAPFAGPALFARLEARGYRIEGLEHVLVRALGARDAELPDASPPGVTVGPVDPGDAEARATWARLSGEGFHAPASPPPDLVRYARLCFDVFDTTAWLAHVDGRPAATGAHSLHDGLCALFGGATLPAARRRGAHRALILARLRAGALTGATLATVGAAPGGDSHRNLEALGFTVAYTRPLLVRRWE